jgi:hypothetical protein
MSQQKEQLVQRSYGKSVKESFVKYEGNSEVAEGE